MSLTEILEAVRALTPEEQAQVRRLLDTLDDSQSPMTEDRLKHHDLKLPSILHRMGRQPSITEDEFERQLAAQGFGTPPDRAGDPGLDDEPYEPIEVRGTPLSRMIVEERR